MQKKRIGNLSLRENQPKPRAQRRGSNLVAGILSVILIFAAATFVGAAETRGVAIKPKAPTGEAVKGDLWLFTIGIDSYLNWNRLNTAVNDAKSVTALPY
ncbi:MAG: hypothetical protein EPN22_07285 [Nitrospirae bacterium]|nr:MAG: hypothetical protein EPN22_07285 [Nitrospirota bacterium]